jgi:hypothetical protein
MGSTSEKGRGILNHFMQKRFRAQLSITMMLMLIMTMKNNMDYAAHVFKQIVRGRTIKSCVQVIPKSWPHHRQFVNTRNKSAAASFVTRVLYVGGH